MLALSAWPNVELATRVPHVDRRTFDDVEFLRKPVRDRDFEMVTYHVTDSAADGDQISPASSSGIRSTSLPSMDSTGPWSEVTSAVVPMRCVRLPNALAQRRQLQFLARRRQRLARCTDIDTPQVGATSAGTMRIDHAQDQRSTPTSRISSVAAIGVIRRIAALTPADL